ncbi:protein DpdF [Brucella anthropi]|uniref:protein DpdF n=1 Tax=Brucella anthropi TaxID=529 RepID=UPI0024496AFF|nr:protein DpdF [Brucella anthropi]MDG9793529.1 protein DpdF [Brucella anthropi]MDH0583358.1 protein DpdF [Brucella anthropi]MDH0819930.1 protein DpdF [Brucella anthropi]MDH2086721.1 protein DpdF [Brucella anthropi]
MNANLDFDVLYAVLAGWPSVELPTSVQDGVFDRILQMLTLYQAQDGAAVSSDFISLLRQVLRRHALQTETTARLRVPALSMWPTRDQWAQFGIRAQRVGTHQFLIEADPYAPSWLGENDVPIFEDSFAEREVRLDWRQPIDPFLADASDFSTYTSPGQREAVRSAFLMAPGETLIVSLPTGSGKSFVAQAPVLVRGLESGLTLCVVPTTALALDQARQTTKLIKNRHPRTGVPELAWHAGLTDEERTEIKSAIRQGRQGVLYCSPEAVTGALLPALYDAARAGFLAYLIIDEAHLVSQWGDGFRPAFQMLSGVRRGLLDACGGERFRTILMSATLTSETVGTIDALFGPARTTQMIASIHLRPEPQYWVHRELDEKAKVDKILDAIRHAPRPFILYVTKRDDARAWMKRLRANGFLRTESFHGETGDGERRRIIDMWAGNKLDGIVATSAFGVGIDKQDVRTVIHATVPETLDRFYQEVGRGGRDGKTSTSLLIYSKVDRDIAERLSAPSLISEELGFERWSAMLETAKPLNPTGSLLELSLDVVPPRLHQQTDYNAAWNMRTLIMMARANMIDLESRPPEALARDEGELDAAFDLRNEEHWAQYFRQIIVSTNEFAHRSKEVFDARIGEERGRSMRAAEAGNELLDSLLQGSTEVSSLLDDLYRSHAPRRAMIVSRACGGCPAHRAAGSEDLSYAEPVAQGIDLTTKPDTSAFEERFPHLSVYAPILLPLPAPFDPSQVIRVFEALVATFGIREIGVSDRFRMQTPALNRLHTRSTNGILLLQSMEEERQRMSGFKLARATLLEEGMAVEPMLLLDRPLHVLLLPATTKDPFHPERRLVETDRNTITYDQFMLGARA